MDKYQNIYTLPYFSNRLDSKSQFAYYHLVIFIRGLEILALMLYQYVITGA